MDSFELHNILFVYDSLMRGRERQSFLSQEKTRFIGPATTPGELYAIGDFPGLVLTTSFPTAPAPNTADCQVHGELFEILDPPTFFATLDVIEGYWPEQTERSLFVRRLINVQTATGAARAWAYILNIPLNGLPRFDENF
jgi:gamma-glutamylcyclotransferase (GGCT)/AIG2-like uncharacterized protein YtfP